MSNSLATCGIPIGSFFETYQDTAALFPNHSLICLCEIVFVDIFSTENFGFTEQNLKNSSIRTKKITQGETELVNAKSAGTLLLKDIISLMAVAGKEEAGAAYPNTF